MVFWVTATADAAAAAATLTDAAAAIDYDAAAADDWYGAYPNARVTDVPGHAGAQRCEIDRATSTPVHADGVAGALDSACTIPVPTNSSALQAAVDIINIAETAASAGDADAALSAVSRHTWSAVYCSILWEAAGGESARPVVDWLTVAARHCFVPMAEGDRAGPDIVSDAWAAVRAAVGAAGVHSHAELAGWYAAMFGSTVRPGGHLRRAAQHFLVDSSVEAAGGKPLLEQLLAALTLHIAAQPGLARLLAIECEAALDETSRCDRRSVRSTLRRGRAALHPPPAEVTATSHIVEFDGASLQNPGPAGAGALIRAPAAQGGGIIWACSAPLGVRNNNHPEYSGAIYPLRAAARLIDAPVTALHCRGDRADGRCTNLVYCLFWPTCVRLFARWECQFRGSIVLGTRTREPTLLPRMQVAGARVMIPQWSNGGGLMRVGALAALSIASTSRVRQAAAGHVHGDSGADDFAVTQIRTIGRHLADPS